MRITQEYEQWSSPTAPNLQSLLQERRLEQNGSKWIRQRGTSPKENGRVYDNLGSNWRSVAHLFNCQRPRYQENCWGKYTMKNMLCECFMRTEKLNTSNGAQRYRQFILVSEQWILSTRQLQAKTVSQHWRIFPSLVLTQILLQAWMQKIDK